nr:3B [mischivirus C1]
SPYEGIARIQKAPMKILQLQ